MKPGARLDEHRLAAFLEDYTFLKERGGLTEEAIAKRLGMPLDTLQNKLRKAGVEDRSP